MTSKGHPFLTGEAAKALRAAGAGLVGIDSYNIDDTGDPSRPVPILPDGEPIRELI